jgi:short-subunit dehydrogenase involved in D-alanine esterification of teichoic acids
MAIDLLSRGKKVIIVGRSVSKLEAAASEIGATAYYQFDTSSISSIPSFLSKVVADHPDLDCIINNAGVQTPLQIYGPDYEFDLGKADMEIDINIRGPLHLTTWLLKNQFNKLEGGGGVVMNVSSVLGFVPFSVVNPIYNGTKAWTHFFTMNLRTQLERAGSTVKVVEIIPPMVETELHRDRKDPKDNSVDKGGMSVDAFMEELKAGWENDDGEISPGMGKKIVGKWQEEFGSKYDKMAQ